jgi:hypothetical protein
MDKLDVLIESFNFVIVNNPKARRSVIAWVFVDGDRVYAVIRGSDAQRASNAVYHALRAMGRRRVRRVASRIGWVVSYV